jgi:hypothetical protein
VQCLSSTGPTRPALRQLKAAKQFTAVWALFNEDQQAVLLSVILQNRSVTATAALSGQSPARLMQTLVELLDTLARHFDIRQDREAA